MRISPSRVNSSNGLPRALPSAWRQNKAALIYGAAVAMLLLAWIVTNPPSASFDEPQHYTKAIGVATGQILGQPGGYVPEFQFPPQTARWLASQTTRMELPANKDASSIDCNLRPPADGGECLALPEINPPARVVTTYVGRYVPYLYFVPGLFTLLGGNPASSLTLGRVGAGITCFIPLLLAAWYFLRAKNPAPYVGLVIVITPMVLFIAAELSASGAETVAAIAFMSSLLALTRDQHPRGVWVAVGVSGVILALSRTLGPIWVVLITAVVVVYSGISYSLHTIRSSGRNALVAIGAVACAAVATGLWELLVQAHASQLTGNDIAADLQYFKRDIGDCVRHWIGGFGLVPLPDLVVQSWFAVAILLSFIALLMGTWRQRIVLLFALVLVPIVVLAIAIFIIYPIGPGGLQGRYMLPYVVVVPLLSAETISRNWHRLGHGWPLRIGLVVALAMTAMCALNELRALATNWDEYRSSPNFFPIDYHRLPTAWNIWTLVACALLMWGVWSFRVALGRGDQLRSLP